MPKAFDSCVKAGGRVRTLKPKGKGSRTYIKVCCPKSGGPCVGGHTKKRKK